MRVKLLTEHHLDFLSLKGDSTGSSESILVKMPHCCKSHVMAHLFFLQGQGKVREFCKMVREIRKPLKVREKAENFKKVFIQTPKTLNKQI